jgi:hypothetical protein
MVLFGFNTFALPTELPPGKFGRTGLEPVTEGSL